MTQGAASDPAVSVPRGRGVPVVVRIGVALALLALVWRFADGPEALARLGAVQWPWLVAALLTANAQIVLSAQRWRIVARQLGNPLSLERAVGEYYLAQLVNQTVPGGVVGDAARAVRARHGAGLSRAAQGVVIERMAGQIALLAILAGGIGVSILVPGGIAWPVPTPRGLVFAALAVAVGAVLVLVVRRARLKLLVGMAAAIHAGLFARPVFLSQALLSLAIVGCNLATFAFSARATATVLPVEAVFTLIPLILIAMLIPATIGGWGFREGAAAALFPLAGATAAAGFAASLAFGLVILAASLPGALWLARAGVSKPSHAAEGGRDIAEKSRFHVMIDTRRDR